MNKQEKLLGRYKKGNISFESVEIVRNKFGICPERPFVLYVTGDLNQTLFYKSKAGITRELNGWVGLSKVC